MPKKKERPLASESKPVADKKRIIKKAKKTEKKIQPAIVEKKQEKQAEIKRPLPVMDFLTYCSIRKIHQDHRAGMAAFKAAKQQKLPLTEWDKLFKDY